MKKFLYCILFVLLIGMVVGCGRHHRHNYISTNNPSDPGNSVDTALVLVLGNPTTGHVDGLGDVDWFCLELEEGKEYCFETLNLSSGLDTVLVLADQTGLGVIAENDNVDDDSLRSKLCVTADYTGKHYLIVSFKESSTGMYDLIATGPLSVDPPDDPPTPDDPPDDDHPCHNGHADDGHDGHDCDD